MHESVPFLILINVMFWPVLQLSIGELALDQPPEAFGVCRSWLRLTKGERRPGFYRRYFGIHRWKGWIPDGARWLGGSFGKASFAERSPEYCRRFELEALRSEAAHWLMLSASPLSFFWNPPWASVVMALTGIVLNVPCILIQRRVRVGLERVLNS